MDLFRGLLAAVDGVLPGYFWAASCAGPTAWPSGSPLLGGHFPMATVPAIAVLLARLTGTGVSLLIALASVVAVAGSGVLACRIWGPAGGSAALALLVFPVPSAIPASWRC